MNENELNTQSAQSDVETTAPSPATTEGAQSPAPRKKHTTLIVGVILLLVLAAVGGAAYWYVTNTRTAADEQTAYEILENNDNPQDYEDFLANYPQSQHAAEVEERLAVLNEMLQTWNKIALSDNVNDFTSFKEKFQNAKYARLCDIKIDSLDWNNAQAQNSEEAIQRYLDAHPEGRYASEASIALGNIHDNIVTSEDQDAVMKVCNEFFEGFENQDETKVCSNITATMTQFLSQKNATKADVVRTIKAMFSEHIQGCSFVLNRDVEIKRSEAGFVATFTVDQHIQRDNEGKTFGSYKCEAVLNAQMLISSLTLTEISANR